MITRCDIMPDLHIPYTNAHAGVEICAAGQQQSLQKFQQQSELESVQKSQLQSLQHLYELKSVH